MSILQVVTTRGFNPTSFALNISAAANDPGQIKYGPKSIILKGDDGCQVEFFGKNLDTKHGKGFITEAVFTVNGKEVATISDFKVDIHSKEWAAAYFTAGYAPVSLALGLLGGKGHVDEEVTYFGNRGDDTLSGDSDTANYLFGGKGNDFFFAGKGVDHLAGGEGFDEVSYFRARVEDGVTVSLADPSLNKGIAKGDTYESIEDVTGSFGNDKLIGDDEANVLDGSLGNDTLIGGGGRDTLDGGKGDPDGYDFVSYEDLKETGGFGVYVSLAEGVANGGGVAGEKLRNIEGVIGSSFRDRLIGDNGDNTLYGEDGSDTLVGGLGADTLRGDEKAFGFSDADMFEYRSAKDGGDTILDYDIYDQIGISRKGFGLSDSFAVVDGVSFIKAANASAVNGGPTFLFDTKTSKLFFDADGTGSGKAVLLATIKFDNPDSIDAGDFVLLL